jgi:hypothetical protein
MRAPLSAALVVALLASATAHAQLFRAYLAPTGLDTNPCTLPAPCRLLPAALAAVAAGGEIWMLDSANYNTAPVAIAKSVTILAVPGAEGSVVATGGNAIDIGTAGVEVVLRNLVIGPLPGAGGQRGINLTAGAGLTVEDCLIANLPAEGIVVGGAASLRLTNTTIRNNGNVGLSVVDGAQAIVTRALINGNSNSGIQVSGTVAGTARVDIADSTMDGNAQGITVNSQAASAVLRVSVRDSQIVRNANGGVVAISTSGASVTVSASRNIVSHNVTGIASNLAGAKVWASANTVTENSGDGLFNNNFGAFESAGDNSIHDNGANTSGPITVVPLK